MFMGSWLLLLCQTCLAVVDDVNSQNQSTTELSNSCHAPDIEDSISENSNEHNKQCKGVCDCDDLSITINSEKNSDLTEKIKFSPDLYAYVVPKITLSNRALSNYRLSTTPERAIFLPLQHYTVLLI